MALAGCTESQGAGVVLSGLDFFTGGVGVGESVELPELVESALEGSELTSELATPVWPEDVFDEEAPELESVVSGDESDVSIVLASSCNRDRPCTVVLCFFFTLLEYVCTCACICVRACVCKVVEREL